MIRVAISRLKGAPRNAARRLGARALFLGGGLAALSACVHDVQRTEGSTIAALATPITPPPTMQYLYGSGEAVALSRQAYSALAAFVSERVRAGDQERHASVVLSSGATLIAPRFADCAGKPPAIVLDVDETAVLNLGYEADEASRGGAYDSARWSRWEQTGGGNVAAVPGVVEAVRAIRASGVMVVFNSNRSAANASYTAQMLDRLELGPAKHGTTLLLSGDDATGSKKDGRRLLISRSYCVIAMAGDQLGDFSDLFNAIDDPAQRRAAAEKLPIAALWGSGWFMLPNPVYGPGIKGDMDSVFPVRTRWRDPAGR